MAELVIPDMDEPTLTRLQERAAANGRTLQAEVKVILTETARLPPAGVWDRARAIQDRLAASGRSFSDSTDLLREDRDR